MTQAKEREFGVPATSNEADLTASDNGGRTVYDSLREALSDKVKREPLTLTVPGRPKVALRFNVDIEFELFDGWVQKASKGAQGKKRDGNPDYIRLAMMVISHTNEAVLFNNEVATNKRTGETLDIRQPEIHEMLGVPQGSVGIAIRRLYGNDGHAIQTMHRVIEAAGYSLTGDIEDADDVDPLEI